MTVPQEIRDQIHALLDRHLDTTPSGLMILRPPDGLTHEEQEQLQATLQALFDQANGRDLDIRLGYTDEDGKPTPLTAEDRAQLVGDTIMCRACAREHGTAEAMMPIGQVDIDEIVEDGEQPDTTIGDLTGAFTVLRCRRCRRRVMVEQGL